MKKFFLICLLLLLNLSITACTSSLKHTSVIKEHVAVISFNPSITIEGDGATVNGSIIHVFRGGTYIFNGTLINGYIEVNTNEHVKLVLNGVTITNPYGPAIFIQNGKSVVLELKQTNYLADGDSENVHDAVIFSNKSLLIEGDGTLSIKGNNEEGISSEKDIIINSGTLRISAKDDGLNAKDDITINDGYLYIQANGDGIDSNGSIHINGGVIISLGSTSNENGGLDATVSYTITGGTVIATGSKIVQPDEYSTQNSLYLVLEKKQMLETLIHIQKDEEEILTFSPASNYKVFYFSSKELVEGSTYDINIGGTSTGTNLDGIYKNGVYTKGSFSTTLNASKRPLGMEVPVTQ